MKVGLTDAPPHIKHREPNDCTVTALALAGRISYRKAYAFWAWKGREPEGPIYVPRALDTLVAQYGKLPVRLTACAFKPRSFTVATFGRRFPEGRFFVLLSNHAVAAVNGTVYDWNLNPRRIVIGAWLVEPSTQKTK